MGVGRHLHGNLGLREGAMWRERIGWDGGGVGVGLGLGGGWGALYMAVSCCVSVKKGGRNGFRAVFYSGIKNEIRSQGRRRKHVFTYLRGKRPPETVLPNEQGNEGDAVDKTMKHTKSEQQHTSKTQTLLTASGPSSSPPPILLHPPPPSASSESARAAPPRLPPLSH